MKNLELSTVLGGERRSWSLDGDVLTIGRSSRNTRHLPAAPVSKQHAEIVRDGGGWQVRDLGSRNGTRVNGVDVQDAAPVKPGDTIEFGQVPVRIGAEPDEMKTQFSPGVGSSVKIRAQQILERSEPRGQRADLGRLVRVLAEAGRVLVLPRPLRETCEEILQFVEQAVPASR